MHRIGVRAGLGIVLTLAAGTAAVLGWYPVAEVLVLIERTGPILVFAAAMTVVAQLADRAGVFTAAAGLIERCASGRPQLLWLCLSALALTVTVFLSLDTTAVLITTVAIVLARRAALDPRPFALTVVWVANVGSLLLPIGNLTNLLSAQRFGFDGALQFAAGTWAPWLGMTSAALLIIAIVHRRTLFASAAAGHGPQTGRYAEERAEDRATAPSEGQAVRDGTGPGRRTAMAVLGVFAALLVSGVPPWASAIAAAAALGVAALLREPDALRAGLIPWRTLILIVGMFAATGAAGHLLRGPLEAIALPDGPMAAGAVLAGAGAVTANVTNNLPAYLALEPLARSSAQAVPLLVGVNAGSLITPWASLATLLWHERLLAGGVRISWARYALLGALATPVCVAVGVVCTALV